MKVRIHVRTDKLGSEVEKSIDTDDIFGPTDLTLEDVEETAREEMLQMIEWGFEFVDKNGKTIPTPKEMK
jgi:hypothetical protein